MNNDDRVLLFKNASTAPRLMVSLDSGRSWSTCVDGVWTTILDADDQTVGILNNSVFIPSVLGVQMALVNGLIVPNLDDVNLPLAIDDTKCWQIFIAIVVRQHGLTDVALVDAAKLWCDRAGRQLGADVVYNIWTINDADTVTWMTTSNGRHARR